MPPFEYRPYRNPYVSSISDLMERQGQIPAQAAQTIGNAQANAALQSGQAWAGAAQGVGQAVSGAIQQVTDPRRKLEALQVQQAQQGQTDLKALDAAFTQPGGREAILNALPGHLRPTVSKQFSEADAAAANLQETQLKAESATTSYVQTLAEIAKAHDYDPTALQLSLSHARETFRNNPSLLSQVGQFESALHQNPTAETVKAIVDPILSAKDAQEKATVLPSTPRGGAPAQLVKAGKVIATGLPSPDQPPTPASIAMEAAGGDAAEANKLLHPTPQTSQEWKDVLLDGKPAKVFVDPKSKAITDLAGTVITNPEKRIGVIPPASTIINPTQLSDVKESVAAMKDGTAPPLLPGRATNEYLATIAEAHRQGFDIQAAVTDWNATQKHISTMNGAQQLRLSQSINALPEMLDKVDALASQWKGGQFPLLNKANLALAKGGAFGSEVASVARQLDQQIADVTSDLGSVYMGGNSPTDHALKLAGTALASDWDEKVLHDMVKLAKGNVTIRANSIKNTGVAGASTNNPYAPAVAAPATSGETWVRDANGKLVKK